jgi:hypothetical protein
MIDCTTNPGWGTTSHNGKFEALTKDEAKLNTTQALNDLAATRSSARPPTVTSPRPGTDLAGAWRVGRVPVVPLRTRGARRHAQRRSRGQSDPTTRLRPSRLAA